ncbi:MAG: glycine cleavage system protein GcvH [Bacilli bacterium]|jgi:glycine cleavage system H protein|nr:glycine cleavage system protein GcvH [Acholeplasmataceae bacterium]
MSKILKDLLYLASHEWVRVEGNVATIGITDYAQSSLGSIVYLEASEVDETVTQNETFGTVESVKAASDLVSPVSGQVIEVNQDVIDNPEKLNEDSYANWIIKVEISDQEELKNLLDATAYEAETKYNV